MILAWLRTFAALVSGHRRDVLAGEYLPEATVVRYAPARAELIPSSVDDEAWWFKPWEGPLDRIPRTRREVYQVFGDPGVGKVDKKWERANMVLAKNLPGIGKKYVHRKAEPYIRQFLERCEAAGILHEFVKFGCWSFRHQRHDPRRPLSDHAFGMAFDIDPKDNRAVKFPNRNPPTPWSAAWFEIWPNSVSETLVKIAKAVGFEWGGDWLGLCDPMHFSLRKR